jgi:hypothetical protein
MVEERVLSAGFNRLFYLLSANQENFDFGNFVRSLGGDASRLDAGSVSAAPRNEKDGLFHVHCSWRTRRDEFQLRVEYFSGAMRHAVDEHEPYAEDFMAWIGKSFRSESVKAHVHARFDYPIAERRRNFVLPQVEGLAIEAELVGTRFRLPSKPHGVNTVAVTQLTTRWDIDVIANVPLAFATFSLAHDVESLESVINIFIEEVQR